MSEEDVQKEIKTPAVLEAFERAKLISLPDQVRKDYITEEKSYANISEYVEKERDEGRAEGKAEVAQNLLKLGIEISVIAAASGLSEEDIRLL